MGCSRAAPAWRSAAVALCLLPVVLPLVLLWLPLLCLAVAVVRFRRRRRRILMTMTSGGSSSSSCCFGGGDRFLPPPEREAEGGEGHHRAALLHKYLEDQMELVEAEVEAEADDAMAAALATTPA